MTVRDTQGRLRQYHAGVNAPERQDPPDLRIHNGKSLGVIQVQERTGPATPTSPWKIPARCSPASSSKSASQTAAYRWSKATTVAAFLNSLTVTIPATLIPILIAAFAAYGFAWMAFPGRKAFFIMVVALLVVPPADRIGADLPPMSA